MGTMSKKQQTALVINFLGLLFFVIWLVIRNRLPNVLSISFAATFLILLAVSLVLLVRAVKSINEKTER